MSGQHQAENAVNGKTDDFTHTLREPGRKWWMVDLEKNFYVSSLKIWNRLTFGIYKSQHFLC